MAKVIQRHWKLLFLQVVFMGAIASLIVWHTARPDQATAQIPVPGSPETPGDLGMDVGTYQAVKQLRQQLALTSADLAAMGCSQGDAKRLLGTLVQWYEANQASLRAQDTAINQNRNQLRRLQRKIKVGPRDEGVIAEARELHEQLAQQINDRRSFIVGAKDTAYTVITADQRSIHEVALANRGVPNRFRYVPDLTDEQMAKIHQALARKTIDNTAATRVVEQALNMLQQSTRTQALTNQRQQMQGVLAAERAVLPIPRELIAPGPIVVEID